MTKDELEFLPKFTIRHLKDLDQLKMGRDLALKGAIIEEIKAKKRLLECNLLIE